MEDITDADYMYAKRVFKDFEIKNLGTYHDLYLSDTLRHSRTKMCSKFYHSDLAKIILAPGLAWQAALK